MSGCAAMADVQERRRDVEVAEMQAARFDARAC